MKTVDIDSMIRKHIIPELVSQKLAGFTDEVYNKVLHILLKHPDGNLPPSASDFERAVIDAETYYLLAIGVATLNGGPPSVDGSDEEKVRDVEIRQYRPLHGSSFTGSAPRRNRYGHRIPATKSAT